MRSRPDRRHLAKIGDVVRRRQQGGQVDVHGPGLSRLVQMSEEGQHLDVARRGDDPAERFDRGQCDAVGPGVRPVGDRCAQRVGAREREDRSPPGSAGAEMKARPAQPLVDPRVDLEMGVHLVHQRLHEEPHRHALTELRLQRREERARGLVRAARRRDGRRRHARARAVEERARTRRRRRRRRFEQAQQTLDVAASEGDRVRGAVVDDERRVLAIHAGPQRVRPRHALDQQHGVLAGEAVGACPGSGRVVRGESPRHRPAVGARKAGRRRHGRVRPPGMLRERGEVRRGFRLGDHRDHPAGAAERGREDLQVGVAAGHAFQRFAHVLREWRLLSHHDSVSFEGAIDRRRRRAVASRSTSLSAPRPPRMRPGARL